jgi:hypothetical protein
MTIIAKFLNRLLLRPAILPYVPARLVVLKNSKVSFEPFYHSYLLEAFISSAPPWSVTGNQWLDY